VIPTSNVIEQFKILSIDIKLKQPFENPYDPQDIRVDAIFHEPDGHVLVLPCFYKNGSSGGSEWEVRFTSKQAGLHSYYIQAISGRDTSISNTYRVEVKASGNDGFLRLNTNSLYSFRFDSGERFRGVGLNLGWELQSQWRHTYETYFDELEKQDANFTRIWMCPWNLPLEWTRVLNYETSVDELESWDNSYSHSSGLRLNSGLTNFTEDDTNRVTIESKSKESIIYHRNDIRRFKIKLFYKNRLSTDRIRCYVSSDNKTYSPIDIEFSQTWNTYEDWHRIFIAYISDLPDGMNYLKIEFLDSLEGSPQIANVFIEHGEPRNILDAPGLGRYYQKTADRLDEILRYAEEKGIYIMLTIDYHGLFKSEIDRWASNAEWRANPYNAANGGPCQTQEDFFTNAEARKLYKNRLRYMVARWGYSTHLAVWEFWNEIDNVMEWQNVSAEAITAWHREMADYLKRIDPYEHLVSTSVTYRDIPGLWDIENLDFSQHHNYGPTTNMKESIYNYIARFEKADVVGEFALGWKGPGKDYPVALYEVEMHNGLWRGMFSPTPILPMTWWWEWHYHQKHFFHFKVAADFISIILKEKDDALQEIAVQGTRSLIETMGLRSGNELYVWVNNSTEDKLDDLVIIIPGTGNARYFTTTFNTWTGEFSQGVETESTNDRFVFKGVDLRGGKDMALWLRLEKDKVE
jgi:hypothetical protein